MKKIYHLDVDSEMQLRASRYMAKRSITGSYLYLLVWVCIIIPQRFFLQEKMYCFLFTLAFIVLVAIRLLVVSRFKRLYNGNGLLWKACFYPSVLVPALVWGGLCSLALVLPEFEPLKMLLVICIAGLTSSSAIFVPDRPLTIGLITAYLLPPVATMLYLGGYDLSLLLVIIIYWAGMFSITGVQYREYWQGVKFLSYALHHAEELEHENTIDGLTGINNRAFFDAALVSEIKKANRTQSSLALLFFDIDHFKKVNDCHGHLAGDQCLIKVAELLQQHAQREHDIVARYGGEEFAVILNAVSWEESMLLAEEIRRSVEAIEIKFNGKVIRLTVSVGVTHTVPGMGLTVHDLIGAADSALYESKEGGRNQIRCRLIEC